MKVTSPKIVAELLKTNGLSPLKKFGQNFLIDDNIVEKIAEAAVPEGANVLEVGTGLGALTLELAKRAKSVVSVEIDRGLVQTHAQTFAGIANIAVVEGDILKLELNAVCREHFGGQRFYVCGNLPYYITSKILLHVLESMAPVQCITAMVQKEVAARLAAQPGDTEYGAFTASCCYYADVTQLFTVSRNCFYPAPDVDSAIIQFDLSSPTLDVPRDLYTRTVRTAFSMRRKTLYNNLKQIAPGEKIQQTLNALGIAANTRAQDISPQQFAKLAHMLFTQYSF